MISSIPEGSALGRHTLTVAIMQPYFLPYIGYFQLLSAVDSFVVYDHIKYTKKGWINRNRFLLNGTDAMFSLPLKKGADGLDVADRELSADFDRTKLLNQFKGAYQRAPHFEATFAILDGIVHHKDDNLFRYIHHSLATICNHLGIDTKIVVSSTLGFDNNLKAQDKVLAICDVMNATSYINSIGGTDLYNQEDFNQRGVELKFLRSRPFSYPQFGNQFAPWLSIVDVLMFNPVADIRAGLMTNYDLL